MNNQIIKNVYADYIYSPHGVSPLGDFPFQSIKSHQIRLLHDMSIQIVSISNVFLIKKKSRKTYISLYFAFISHRVYFIHR